MANELRQWDEMPDVAGYYFFSGEVPNRFLGGGYWMRIRTIVTQHPDADGKYWASTGNEEYKIGEMRGTWYGPLTPPWRDSDDGNE